MSHAGQRAGSVVDLEVHLGYWLRRVSNRVSGEFKRALQARHVSVAEWVALQQMQGAADITSSQLAETLGLTRGAISKVLDKLEAKAWIARTVSEEDNRVHFLRLTRQGTRALPQLAEIANQNDEQFFRCLDTQERDNLQRLLRKLTAAHNLSDVPVD